jgi:putative colanic acid biosynthesis UDP-glucose lipid carrier transferase
MNFSVKENASLLALFLRLIDSAIIIACGTVCFYLLEPIKEFPSYTGYLPENYLTVIVLGFIFSAWWFPAFNLYQSWRGANLSTEIRALLLGWGCSLLGVLAFIFFTKTATDFSRHWLFLWFISSFILLSLLRVTLRTLLKKVRNKGYNLRSIVLVGGGNLSQQVAKKIQKSSWMGLKIKGVFSDLAISNNNDLPTLGNINEVLSYINKNDIDQVWITLPLKKMEQIEQLCKQLHSTVVDIKLVPDIASLRLLNYSATQLDGMPIINMSVSPMSNTNRLLKWIEDKVLSLLILLIISPLLCIIALAVKSTSSGPIFYKQERIGSNGKTFQMLKFRSMPVESESHLEWGKADKKQKTIIGSFLRKTSLDELPQFINVLKGDMSIVGPRPERTVFVNKFKHEIDSYMQKHLVHAGITGWAQANGWRGDTCLKTRIDYDLFYVENWSLWFDLKIIWMTMFKGFNNGDKV